MNPDGPKKSKSMSICVNDDAVSRRHPSSRRDSPADGSMPPNLPHPTDPLILPSSLSFPLNYPYEDGNVYGNQGPRQQHRDILLLKPFVPEPTSRKRNRSDDAPQGHPVEHDTNNVNPSSSKRPRPRPRTREGIEFSPLLIIPPAQDVSVEEKISVSHFAPHTTHSFGSIQRYFLPEHGPSIPQTGSSKDNDLGDSKERGRSSSAKVAMTFAARKRLSSLQDLSLPRPFDNTEKSSSSGSIVHERGLGIVPFFLPTKRGRVGKSLASCESAGSSRHVMPSLQASSTKFFDKPLCESPDSLKPGDGPPGLRDQTAYDPGAQAKHDTNSLH